MEGRVAATNSIARAVLRSAGIENQQRAQQFGSPTVVAPVARSVALVRRPLDDPSAGTTLGGAT